MQVISAQISLYPGARCHGRSRSNRLRSVLQSPKARRPKSFEHAPVATKPRNRGAPPRLPRARRDPNSPGRQDLLRALVADDLNTGQVTHHRPQLSSPRWSRHGDSLAFVELSCPEGDLTPFEAAVVIRERL